MIKRGVVVYGAILTIYAGFCLLMLQIMLQYIPYNTDTAFLAIKQDEVRYLHYRIAFFTHVYSSMLILPAGFTQFSAYLRRLLPRLHRLMGKIYVFVILIFTAPSGLIMAWYANGGFWSQTAFSVLSILWFCFTFFAFRFALKKNFREHQKWMLRSFSLSLSAITLRLWKYIIVYLWHPPPMDVYRIVAWLGWVLNLVLAEIIIFKYLKNEQNNSSSVHTTSS